MVDTFASGAGRNKLAAALLAFFLGGFGAHWFYLGRRDWGSFYLVAFLLSVLTAAIFIGFIGFVFVGGLCLYDFISLLSLSESEFQAKYNNG